MEKGIYKLNVYCGRSGSLEGLFVAEKSHVKELIDSEIKVFFGEVLGKHSEVFGSIEQKDISLISDSIDAIKVIEDLKLESGYNPFYYTAIHCEDSQDDETVGEIISRRLLKV